MPASFTQDTLCGTCYYKECTHPPQIVMHLRKQITAMISYMTFQTKLVSYSSEDQQTQPLVNHEGKEKALNDYIDVLQ